MRAFLLFLITKKRRVHKRSIMHQSIEITKVYDALLTHPTLAINFIKIKIWWAIQLCHLFSMLISDGLEDFVLSYSQDRFDILLRLLIVYKTLIYQERQRYN